MVRIDQRSQSCRPAVFRMLRTFGVTALLALVNYTAQAQPSGPRWRMEVINMRTDMPVRVQLRVRVQSDGCNQIGLTGGLRRLQPLYQTIEQDFFADLEISSTLVRCIRPGPDGTLLQPETKEVVLTSGIYEINPIAGTIISQIYVQDGFELIVLPRSGAQ